MSDKLSGVLKRVMGTFWFGSSTSGRNNPNQRRPTTYGGVSPDNRGDFEVRESQPKQSGTRPQLKLIEAGDYAAFVGLGKAVTLGGVRTCRDIKVTKLRKSKYDFKRPTD